MATTKQQPARNRRWTGLEQLTVVALLGTASIPVYYALALSSEAEPIFALFGLVPLVTAGLVLRRWRWAPALAALWSAGMLLGNGPALVAAIVQPDETRAFAVNVLFVAVAVVGLGAGLAAAVQNRCTAPVDRHMPRLVPVLLATLVGLVVGALLVAAIPQHGPETLLDSAGLGNLPVLTAAQRRFDRPEIHVKVGATVGLRLVNQDQERHRFDIDAFNVHAPMPTKQNGVALFQATQAGTYTFYCGIPGHRAAGMQGTLIVGP
ncbi:MAG: cupredoxin domain-containing protein [Herpetosiphonaceae bacterium]|nr:cupredoxin domain-containing protein [Herpetosiphonaceae bacterium]